MVKFKTAQERLFHRNVSPAIQNMVHTALQEYRRGDKEAQTASLLATIPQRHQQLIQFPREEDTRLPVTKQHEIVKGGPDYTQQHHMFTFRQRPFSDREIQWLNGLEEELRFNYDTLQSGRKERLEVSPGSCHWIIEKPQYQEFVSSTKNEVLFIEGGPGLGKSSLAKFFTSELASHPSQPIITEYFSKKEGQDNSPKTIIMHVLYQLLQKSEKTFLLAAAEMFSTFTQQRNLEFYWSLFTRVRRSLKANHFCIIDGLDECIRQHRPERQTTVDQQVVGFLRQLIGIAGDENGADGSWTTKILLTTRYEQELEVATAGQKVMKILSPDIAESVKQVVAEKVSELVGRRDVSADSQLFIVADILRRCGPVFQKGVTAVSILANPSLDLNDRETVKAVLDDYNFDKFNDVYTRVLERIQHQDQEMAAKIIRIIYFTRMYFDLGILQHALAMDKENPTVEDLVSLPSRSSISTLINSSFRSLVTFKENETLDLEHPSIYDFLRTLSQRRLQIYSCQNQKEGHLHLALICIRYLTLWRHQPVNGEEIAAADGDELFAAFRKSRLLLYAAQNWHIHACEAAELIEPHIAIVNKLMNVDPTGCITADPEGLFDYFAMVVLNKSAGLRDIEGDDGKNESTDISSQIHFLSSNNVVNILSIYLRSYPKTSKRRFWQFSKRKSQRQIETGIPFDMDDVDESGSTPLHYACRKGYHVIVALLLKAGARGNVLNHDGYSPFACALDGGYKGIAELLLTSGCAFDGGEAKRGFTCIHYAAYHGLTGILTTLLEKYTKDPNSKTSPEGWTPVHMAAQEGHFESVKLLLEAGGLPDLCNSNGVTPLHSASLHGRLDIVKLFFQLYPNLNPSPRTGEGSESHGSTPLNSAARNGHLRVFNYLKLKEPIPVSDEKGNLPIHMAALNGHLSIVSQFRDATTYNCLNKNGRSPLHLAALQGHFEIFTYLKNLGALSQADNSGCLPIHLAALNGHLSIVKLFVGSSHINAWTKSATLPIHFAASNGHLETLKWLRANGSENNPDEDGQFPIHLAANGGHAAILREYLDSSEKENVHLANNRGWLPIHLVAFDGYIEAAKALKDLGANIDAKSEPDRESKGAVKSYPWTALQIAVSNGREALAGYFIQEGANLSNTGPRGEGLIHQVARSGCKELFIWLEKRGHDRWLTDSENNTPLHYGAFSKSSDIVNEYIRKSTPEQPVNLDITNIYGLTPLISAITTEEPCVDNVQVLISAGASVNTRTLTGFTPLMLAVRGGNEVILNTILELNVDVTAADYISHSTALHYAAERNGAACPRLLDLGANINAQPKDGRTPLMRAALNYKVDSVKLLLSKGADTSIEDDFGFTVFDYMKNYPPIFTLLKPYASQNWNSHSATKPEMKIRARVQYYLNIIPDEVPPIFTLEREFWIYNLALLAYCLFIHKDYLTTRICLEIRVFGSEWSEKQLDYSCDVCQKEYGFLMYWCCKQCPAFRGMCDECYKARSEKLMLGCDKEHEFFQIGGKEWARLPQGQIDIEGKEIGEFIRELKEKWADPL
jgi:ankyrin repeat protein